MEEISSSSGFGSMDTGGCAYQLLNCATVFRTVTLKQPYQMQLSLNLSNVGELVLLGGNYGSGYVTAPSGWTPLVNGSVASNTVNTQVIYQASSGAFTATQTSQTDQDQAILQTIAITPSGSGGGGAGFGDTGLLNLQCYNATDVSNCMSGTSMP